MTQQALIQFSPYDGSRIEVSNHRRIQMWRQEGADPWLYNPWNGQVRSEIEQRNDPLGILITMPGDEPAAPMPPAPAFLNAVALGSEIPHLFPGPVGMIENEDDGYAPLAAVLKEAYDQASKGKGHERHANGRPFIDQPIFQINRSVGTNHGAVFQACKKAEESTGLPTEAAIKELLGTIVYAAAAIILLREQAASKGHHPEANP